MMGLANIRRTNPMECGRLLSFRAQRGISLWFFLLPAALLDGFGPQSGAGRDSSLRSE
jgi:hypothetical protein